MSGNQMHQTPQLSIDTLNLRLPRGFEGRAAFIAREASRQLSKLPMAYSVQLDRVNIPRLRLQGGETNGVIARRIAQSIHAQISAPVPARGGSKGGRYV